MSKIDKYKPKHKVTCFLCNTVVYSKREGELTYCKCGAVGIDDTRYYCNVNGISENMKTEELTEEDFREFTWGSLDGEQTKIKDLTNDHLINIVIHLEQRDENNRGYYYELMLDEVELRKLHDVLNERRNKQ